MDESFSLHRILEEFGNPGFTWLFKPETLQEFEGLGIRCKELPSQPSCSFLVTHGSQKEQRAGLEIFVRD